MPTTHVTFRGEEDVAIEHRDHGYEPDTNAQEIEWWFADGREVHPDITPEEEGAILAHLHEIASDLHAWDDDFDR